MKDERIISMNQAIKMGGDREIVTLTVLKSFLWL